MIRNSVKILLQGMEEVVLSPMAKVSVSYSIIDVGEEVILLEDGEDHECAQAGTKGKVIAKHINGAERKFIIRLDCGHVNCLCTMEREQIKVAGWESRVWN